MPTERPIPVSTPPGVVAVLIDKTGREVANASCFNRSTPGGFTLAEAQESRCRRKLAGATMLALASPLLAESIDTYTAENIVRAMCDAGCRVVVIKVGHGEA